jgi:hypothetical protein
MTDDPVLARLAAANPVPTGAPLPDTTLLRGRTRRVAVALAVCAVMALPAATFATQIARQFGFSNEGVATRPPPCCLWSARAFRAAMERGVDETVGPAAGMRRLGTLNGFHFFAAPYSGDPHYPTPNSGKFRPGNQFCYGVASYATANGVASFATAANGCVARGFPSARKPVVVADPGNGTFVGFAADGIASVKLLDASGATLARATVHRNIFAADYRRFRGWVVLQLMAAGPQALLHLTVESLDAAGDVIARTPAGGAHDQATSYPGPPG